MDDISPSDIQQPKHQILSPKQGGTEYLSDNDGIRRTGNVWTTIAYILTAVIGAQVLSISWNIAQLGWVFGPGFIILTAFVIYYTTILLAESYRPGDLVPGSRNYTYTDVVRANLGGAKAKVCAVIQYSNFFSSLILSTIDASVSMTAVKWLTCIHESSRKNACRGISSNLYMIMFGASQLIFSQIPDFDQIWWLSVIATVMGITFSAIGTALGVMTVVDTGKFEGSITGALSISTTQSQKTWRILAALGWIASSYPFSSILIEIQGTIKTPSAVKTMKKASLISLIMITALYMLCGFAGYAAFGDQAYDNIVTDYGYDSKYWLLYIANIALVINSVGGYQVFAQPLFAFVEKWAVQKWPNSKFLTKEIKVRTWILRPFNLNLFHLVWRSGIVVLTTLIPLLLPLFYDIIFIIFIIGFWPLAVYFPVEMYIVQKKIPKRSTKWVGLKILSVVCLLISVAATISMFAFLYLDIKVYKYYHPFTSYW